MGPILVKAPQNDERYIRPNETSKINVFIVVFADCPDNATQLLLGQQWRHSQIIEWNLCLPWARGGPPLCDG